MEKKTAIPSLHSLLDLNSLVSSVNDSNVDFSRVCLLFGTEIVVLANGAVVASFHAFGAGVASVDKLVLVLRMQFIQQGLSGKFAPPQAGEF